ncbi:MAG: hypothetical protein JW384_04341 [Nitrosomonadaceae bacterium]|nr:hypothetical protein [Nitrosomonadaceae bacterium]
MEYFTGTKGATDETRHEATEARHGRIESDRGPGQAVGDLGPRDQLRQTGAGKMLQRWLGTVLLHCEQQLKCVKGFAEIAEVMATIEVEHVEPHWLRQRRRREATMGASQEISTDLLTACKTACQCFCRSMSALILVDRMMFCLLL